MSDSVRPQRWQPTRLPRPWDSPGKNTGVSCHFLLQCMKVKIESEVTQSYPALSDPMDCSAPGSSIHGIFQARVLEWSAIAFSENTYYLGLYKKKKLLSSVLGFPDSSVGKESTCNAGNPDSVPGLGRSPGEGIGYPLHYSWASLVVQLVKNPSEMWDHLGLIPGLGRSSGEGKGYPFTSGILRARW